MCDGIKSIDFRKRYCIVTLTILLAISFLTHEPLRASSPETSNFHDSDTDHGDIQVSALVHDLPQLKDIIYKNNPIWKWLAQAFNYSINDLRIYWDPSPTTKSNTFGGETQFLQSSGTCFIRVDGTDKDGEFANVDKKAEEVLASLVFELNNAQHKNELLAVWQMALKGTLSKNQFILETARVEFESGRGVKSFLIDVWAPFCKANHIESDCRLWWRFQSNTFDEWIKQYPVGSDYPWKIYGDQYDLLIQGKGKEN